MADLMFTNSERSKKECGSAPSTSTNDTATEDDDGGLSTAAMDLAELGQVASSRTLTFQQQEEVLQEEQRFLDYRSARKMRVAARRKSLSRWLPWCKPIWKYEIPAVFDFQLTSEMVTRSIDWSWACKLQERRKDGRPRLQWSDFNDLMSESQPLVTYLVMTVCLTLYLACLALDAWTSYQLGQQQKINIQSFEIDYGTNSLLHFGKLNTVRVLKLGEWYRLITSSFLHADLGHCLSNIWFLWVWGASLERYHGTISRKWRFIIIWILAWIGSNLVTAVFLTRLSSQGASGGVLALIGMGLSDICANWDLVIGQGTARWGGHDKAVIATMLLVELVAILLPGFAPDVNMFSHLGGLLFGFCFAAPFSNRLDRPPCHGALNPITGSNRGATATGGQKVLLWACYCGRMTCFALASVAFVASIVILQTADKIEQLPCPRCQAFFCLELPTTVGDGGTDNDSSISCDIFKQ